MRRCGPSCFSSPYLFLYQLRISMPVHTNTQTQTHRQTQTQTHRHTHTLARQSLRCVPLSLPLSVAQPACVCECVCVRAHTRWHARAHANTNCHEQAHKTETTRLRLWGVSACQQVPATLPRCANALARLTNPASPRDREKKLTRFSSETTVITSFASRALSMTILVPRSRRCREATIPRAQFVAKESTRERGAPQPSA